jgi:hypothetical protein
VSIADRPISGWLLRLDSGVAAGDLDLIVNEHGGGRKISVGLTLDIDGVRGRRRIGRKSRKGQYACSCIDSFVNYRSERGRFVPILVVDGKMESPGASLTVSRVIGSYRVLADADSGSA